MFPGSQNYPEGQNEPQKGTSSWHVWCNTGALKVLEKGEYLTLKPGEKYIINFGNGSAASIHPSHPLWIRLVEITKTHEVAVFQLALTGGYMSWHGNAGSLERFDAIRITGK